MTMHSLHIGSFYLYKGKRVRLLGTHASLNLGSEVVEEYSDHPTRRRPAPPGQAIRTPGGDA